MAIKKHDVAYPTVSVATGAKSSYHIPLMQNDLYNFDLPEELIAQTPAHPRDHARLLIYGLADGSIKDGMFFDLPEHLVPDTTLVVNNSKVDTCRWLFDRNKTEVFVLEKTDTNIVRALVRPGRKFKSGVTINLADGIDTTVLAIDEEGIRTLKLSVSHDDPKLKNFEHIPLPPYIAQNDELASEYQTVYARPLGSLAAPTAGLHFTPELLEKITKKHEVAELTLHVGLGTFAKLTEENLKTGRLHEERFELTSLTANQLNKAKHLTAVGTTTVRTLESLATKNKQFIPSIGTTDIFIRPGYSFKVVESMITNFHLPSTSLLMLVAAFIADKKGLSEYEAAMELQKIYKHAIENNYRFYSFGDAMLLV